MFKLTDKQKFVKKQLDKEFCVVWFSVCIYLYSYLIYSSCPGIWPGTHVVDAVLEGQVAALHSIAVQEGFGGQQTGALFSWAQSQQRKDYKHVQHPGHLVKPNKQTNQKQENKLGLGGDDDGLQSILKL